MKKSMLIAALSLLLGVLLLSASLILGLQDTAAYTQSTQNLDGETVTSIQLSGADSHTVIRTHGKNTILIETDTPQAQPFEVRTENGILTITRLDHRKWYQRIGIFMSPKDYNLRITLPEHFTGDMKLRQNSGRLELENLRVGGLLQAQTSSGLLKASALSADSLELTVTSGALIAESLTASGSIRFSTTSGALSATDITSGERISLGCTSGALRASHITAPSSIELRTSSGLLSGNELHTVGELRVEATSGAIRMESFSADSFWLSATSGGTSLRQAKLQSATASLTSGRLSMDRISASHADLRTVSGAQVLQNVQIDSLTAEASSGSIQLRSCSIGQKATLRASSGGITCRLAQTRSEFTLLTSTESGACNLSSGGSGEKQLSISTSSGRIAVYFEE